jgi:hypothetical protein
MNNSDNQMRGSAARRLQCPSRGRRVLYTMLNAFLRSIAWTAGNRLVRKVIG